MSGRRTVPFAAAVLLATFVGASFAQEAVLFEEAASGILELAGHTRLEIEGFNGTVFVRAGKQGELRYSAATRASRREPHPVALWLRGATMIFRPVSGKENAELILEVAISEGVRIEVEKRGGKVQVASVLGDLHVRAVDSEVDIRGAGEGVSVDLEGGTLRLENLEGPSSASAAKVQDVQLVRLRGQHRLEASESKVRCSDVSSLEIDLDETALDLTGATGWISGAAVESRLGLSGVRSGGALQLESTPLLLERSRGSFEVETDAEMTFRALEGTLKIAGFGGNVIGDGHAGEVTVGNRGARVALSNITGPLLLNGDGLNVELTEIQNKVTMELVGSEVNAKAVRGGLDLSNEYGDVFVTGVEGTTKIVSENGSVQALDLSGSVEIDAAGPEVRVGWRAIGRDQDSRIENTSGDLYVAFPAGSGANVEAEAETIETDLAELEIGDGGRYANGMIGDVKSPTVSLKAAGVLVVSQGSGR